MEKHLDKYHKREKEHRKLLKRLDHLNTIKWKDCWEDLPKPKRHGWIKELALTKEVLRRQDAEVFQEILDACKINTWAMEKKYLENRWFIKYRNKKPQKPGLRKLGKKEFKKLTPAAKKYFSRIENRGCRYNQEPFFYQCTLPRIFFTEVYSKAYVYRIRKVNSEVEKEIAAINKLLDTKYFELERKRLARYNSRSWFEKRVCGHKRKVAMGLFDFVKTGKENEVIYEEFKIGWW